MIDHLVNRFLSWQLPQSVRADVCATDGQYEHPRYGTNLLTADEAAQMIRHVLAGELDYQAYCERDPDHKPDGTLEALATCATMLEQYGPECMPVNDKGQIDFARSMMDATASEIRAFLASGMSAQSAETQSGSGPQDRQPGPKGTPNTNLDPFHD